MPEVEKLLEKAEATLKDAKKAYNQEMLISTVQNRLYYSMYYAVQAALLSQNIEVKTHEGTKIKIGEELILKDKLDEKWGRFYSQQQSYREEADYQIDVDIKRGELEKYLEKAEKFIQEMKEISKK